MQKPVIFISAVSRELKSARQLVSNTLQLLGFEPVWQDVFATHSGDLRAMLQRKIDDAQGVIQLVGHRYGMEPPAPDPDFGRVSYTQFEALYAEQKNKNVWYLFIADDFPIDPADPESPDLTQLQTAYRDRLLASAKLHYAAASPIELENLVHRLENHLEKFRRQLHKNQQRLTAAILAGVALLLLVAAGIYRLSRQSNSQQAALQDVSKTVQSIQQAPAVNPDNLSDLVASASAAQLLRFTDAGVPPAQFATALARRMPNDSKTIARHFFENSKNSPDALRWLSLILQKGLDPNLLVTDDYYTEHALLGDALRSGNAPAVLALLAAGASPHPYQNIWFTAYSVPQFLFPEYYVETDENFTLDEKKQILLAMQAAGAVAFRFHPGKPNPLDQTDQLQSAEQIFTAAPSILNAPLPESPPDSQNTVSPIALHAQQATGFDWPNLVRQIPARIAAQASHPGDVPGEQIDLYWFEIRNLIAISGDKAYFLGAAQASSPQYALIEISKDARQWNVYIFMNPAAGMGICHCEADDKTPPDRCWRKFPMTYDPAAHTVKVLNYYTYAAAPRP